MRPAVRLAALMKLPVIYVWTHDSIGLGEDGPTHQPVEHLAALRAIPGLRRGAPGRRQRDGVRLAHGRLAAHATGPTGADPDPPEPARSSTGAPTPRAWPRAATSWPRRPTAARRRDLIATGSEVQLAVDGREVLADKDIAARVVSMPCVEWFDAQAEAYRDRCCRRRCRRGSPSRPASRRAGARWSATPARSSSIEHYGRVRRRQDSVPRVRVHPGSRRRRRRTHD